MAVKLPKFVVLHERDGNPPLICVVSHKDERGFPIVHYYIIIQIYSKAGGEPDQYRRAVTVYLLTKLKETPHQSSFADGLRIVCGGVVWGWVG